MRRRAFLVGLVLGLMALASTTEAAWAAAETQGAGSAAPVLGAIVLEVVDGDTMEVELDDGARATIRLIGIDTPESVQPGTPVECQAQAATENLNALVDGEAVTLTTDPTKTAKTASAGFSHTSTEPDATSARLQFAPGSQGSTSTRSSPSTSTRRRGGF